MLPGKVRLCRGPPPFLPSTTPRSRINWNPGLSLYVADSVDLPPAAPLPASAFAASPSSQQAAAAGGGGGSGVSGGVVAGLAAGLAAGAVLLVALIAAAFVRRRRRRQPGSPQRMAAAERSASGDEAPSAVELSVPLSPPPAALSMPRLRGSPRGLLTAADGPASFADGTGGSISISSSPVRGSSAPAASAAADGASATAAAAPLAWAEGLLAQHAPGWREALVAESDLTFVLGPDGRPVSLGAGAYGQVCVQSAGQGWAWMPCSIRLCCAGQAAGVQAVHGLPHTAADPHPHSPVVLPHPTQVQGAAGRPHRVRRQDRAVARQPARAAAVCAGARVGVCVPGG